MAPLYPAPRHPLIIEPFAGGAAYSLYHARRCSVRLHDSNADVIRVWRYLQRARSEDVTALPNPAIGTRIEQIPGLTDDEKLLMRMWASETAGGTLRRQVSSWSRERWHARKMGVSVTLPLIRSWDITCGDYTAVENRKATWFIDPPYSGFDKEYQQKNLNYAQLAQWCRSRIGQVIVCERAGATWLPFTVLARTRSRFNVWYYEAVYTQ